MVGADSDDNQVMRNTGSANGGLFIDLGDDGPGATTGANNDIQPPQLTSVTASAVSGTGAPGATVRLFSKAVAGTGEIQAFFGEATVAGDGTWSVAPGPSSPFVGATQTVVGDGTSEMAVGTLPVEPPPPPPPPPRGRRHSGARDDDHEEAEEEVEEAQGEVRVQLQRARLELRVLARRQAVRVLLLAA